MSFLKLKKIEPEEANVVIRGTYKCAPKQVHINKWFHGVNIQICKYMAPPTRDNSERYHPSYV